MRQEVDTGAASLSALFESEADAVFGFLLSRCGSRALAEDLTADTFQAASSRFVARRGHEVTRPWLFTVARRRLIDHWRSENARGRRLERLVTEAKQQSAPPDATADRVEEALDSLPEHYRAVLVLRYLDAHSVSEVADALELSYKATESVLARARAAFSRSWEVHDVE